MVGKRFATVFAGLLTCGLVSSGCGGTGNPPIQSTADPPAVQYYDQAQVELQDMATPEGVDAGLWDRLVAEFLTELEAVDGVRGTSSTEEYLAVTDFDYSYGGRDDVVLEWTYHNTGDYDLNGEVNISDIVLIGRHWGAERGDENWYTEARPADGDNNGMVTSGDLTPIARNYKCLVNRYVLQAKAPTAGDAGWSDREEIHWLDHCVGMNRFGEPRVEYATTSLTTNLDYRLLPAGSRAGGTEALDAPSNTETIYLVQGNNPEAYTGGRRRSMFSAPGQTGVKWIRHLDNYDPRTHPVVDGQGNLHYLSDRKTAVVLSPDTGEVVEELEEYYTIDGIAIGETMKFLGLSYNVSAYDESGKSIWIAQASENAVPIFFQDDRLYFASDMFGTSIIKCFMSRTDFDRRVRCFWNLYGFTDDLAQLWELVVPDPVLEMFKAGPETLYAITERDLLRITDDGELSILQAIDGSGIEHFAVLSDGSFVLASNDRLYILNGDGEPVTDFPYTAGLNITSACSLAVNSRDEIITHWYNFLQCFSREGELLWEYRFSDEEAPPAGVIYSHSTADDKSLIIDAGDRAIVPIGSTIAANTTDWNTGAYAVISPDGELEQLIRVRGGSYMTPLLFGDGQAYLLGYDYFSDTTTLYCLDDSTPTVPPVPTGLTASRGTLAGAIDLAWTGSDLASHYLVYRDGGTNPVTIANETSWADNGLSDTAEHTYTVVAVNTNGMSETSAQATGWIATDAPPVEPGGWNQWQGNAAHTGLGANVFPATLADIEPTAVDQVPSKSILITGDGSFFSNDNNDGALTYFDQAGEVIWDWPYAIAANSMYPALGADGSIYVLCSLAEDGPHCLRAWNPDHTERWVYERPDDWFTNSPVVAPDGTIYVRSNSGRLHSVNPDGTVNWVIKHYGSYCYQNPTVAPDGTVYVVGQVGPDLAAGAGKSPAASSIPGTWYLTAIDPDDGSQMWLYINWDRKLDESPVVSPAGTILVMGESVLHALDDTGNLRWTFGPAGYNHLLGVLEDGSLYMYNKPASDPATLYRLDDAGNTIWSMSGYTVSMYKNVVDAQGNILATDADGEFVCLDSDGAERWSVKYDTERVQDCFVNNDGSLYVYTYDYANAELLLRIYPAS